MRPGALRWHRTPARAQASSMPVSSTGWAQLVHQSGERQTLDVDDISVFHEARRGLRARHRSTSSPPPAGARPPPPRLVRPAMTPKKPAAGIERGPSSMTMPGKPRRASKSEGPPAAVPPAASPKGLGAPRFSLSQASRSAIGKYLDGGALASLEIAISALLADPPIEVPTVKQARRQVLDLHDRARSLLSALESAPWTARRLSGFGGVVDRKIQRLSTDALSGQLNLLVSATRLAENALASQTDSRRGRRPNPVVRGVMRIMFDHLVSSGVRLTPSERGAATVCCAAVFHDLTAMPDVGALFASIDANAQVGTMLSP